MSAVLTSQNIRRAAAPVSVAATCFIAHANDMLVRVIANACNGLIFQNRPQRRLKLASSVVCTFHYDTSYRYVVGYFHVYVDAYITCLWAFYVVSHYGFC